MHSYMADPQEFREAGAQKLSSLPAEKIHAIASAAAAANQKHLPAPKQPLLLLLTEEQQKHLPAPKQQGTEGRTGPRIAPKKCLTPLLNS